MPYAVLTVTQHLITTLNAAITVLQRMKMEHMQCDCIDRNSSGTLRSPYFDTLYAHLTWAVCTYACWLRHGTTVL